MEQSKPTEEKRRLHELYSLNALQTQPDTVLDTFCEKVAKLFDVPSCVVSLVLEDRQWFKSSFGCPVELAQARETPRDISFCTHVVDSRQPLVVKEVSKDPRFKNNPLVQKYGFGFYAGFPLTTGKGHVLGSLCLYDNKPREFSERDLQLLGLFSERVMTHLELCRELGHVKASEAMFRSISQSAHDGLVVMGEDERIIEVNPAMEAMFGWSREELLGKQVEIIMPERYRKRHRESVARSIELGASDKFHRPRQFEALRRDGTEFPIELSISGFLVDGRWTFTAFIRDITERRKAEEALRDSQEHFTAFMDHNPAVAWMKDGNWNYVYINQPFERLFDVKLEGIKGKNDFELWPEATAKELRANDMLVLSSGEPLETFETVPTPDGSPHYWLVLKFPFKDSFGRRFVGGMAVDITERKRAEEALAEQAVRDTLTGLYNRRYFNQRIGEEIARADRNRQPLAILLCDLDHFKTINDTRGHQVGDDILKVAAKGIQQATRGIDLVFRWGGDEIVVVLSESTREGVLIVAQRIREKIREISVKANLTLDISIGVALYPEHARSVDDLIRIADLALYIAKKGGDKVHIGTEEYHLDERGIKVVFQPVVAVQPIKDLRTQKVMGYEALSRDPEGKLSILDLFQKYRAIGKLNELKCICFKTQLKAAQEFGLKRVFINVDFNVLSLVEMIPKPPGMEVILEISELEAIHDVENRLQLAKKWQEQGYKFAIDDFGAGFISLPFIARLIPAFIKIDRSTMLQAVSSVQFKEFMIGMIFGLKNYATDGIIAEGIETEKELKVAKELGIFLIQGFLFGKPQELK